MLSYAAPLDIPADLAGAGYGTLAHRFFELSGAPAPLRRRLDAAARNAGWGEALVQALQQRARTFHAWLEETLQPRCIARELPILYLDAEQRVVNGVIDLAVETAAGWWIIDHKTDRINDGATAFAQYRGQLLAYREALLRRGDTVLGVGIHWVRRGEVTWCSTPTGFVAMS